MYFIYDEGANRSCTGNLLRISELCPNPLEDAIASYNVVKPEQIAPLAAFIRACLRLDPNERASAEQLQVNDWLGSAFGC
jgi:serine/threonine-protein kinase SRPK3